MTSIFSFTGDPYVSNRRFLVLAIFCVYSLSNAMQWLTYSPIPTQVRAFYDISTTQLNMLSTIYMIIYIGLSIISCLGLERIGLRWCLLIGTGLNFIGSLLKLVCGFPTSSFVVLLIAQLINALSQIFVLSVPPTLALAWFKESDRGTATTIGAVANAVGCAIGMLIPPLWVKEGVDLGDGFSKLFGLQLGLCAVAFLGAVVGVPSVRSVVGGSEIDTTSTTDIALSAVAASHEETNGGAAVANVLVSPAPITPTTTPTSANPILGGLSSASTTADETRLLMMTSPGTMSEMSPSPIAGPSAVGELVLYSPAATEMETANIRSADESNNNNSVNVPMPPGNTSVLPPSATVSPIEEEPTSVTEVLKALLHLTIERDVILCVLGLSVSIGSVWAVNSLLAQLLASVNVGESDAGQMGFWNIIAGTILAIIAGPIVDKFRVYKWPIVGLAALNLVCLSLIIMLMYMDSSDLGNNVSQTTLMGIYALNVIAGIPQNVITPIGFEFLMELSHGHPGSISGGMLMGIANAVSLIEVSVGAELLGADTIAQKKNALKAFWLVWAFLVAGLVALILPRNNLKRLRAQEEDVNASHPIKSKESGDVTMKRSNRSTSTNPPTNAMDIDNKITCTSEEAGADVDENGAIAVVPPAPLPLPPNNITPQNHFTGANDVLV